MAEPTPAEPKPNHPIVASIKGELQSRKWRAMIVQLAGAIGILVPNLDTLWGWIVAGAMWAMAISSYILGTAIEDNGVKRGVAGDTNITVAGSGASAPVVRTRRTSLSPVVTDGKVGERVDTVETEVNGADHG